MFMVLAEVSKSNLEISQPFNWYTLLALVFGFTIGFIFTFLVMSNNNNKTLSLGISRGIGYMFGIVKPFPNGIIVYCDNTTNNKPIMVIIPKGYELAYKKPKRPKEGDVFITYSDREYFYLNGYHYTVLTGEISSKWNEVGDKMGGRRFIIRKV